MVPAFVRWWSFAETKKEPAKRISRSVGFAICSPRGMGEPRDVATRGSRHLSCVPICTGPGGPQGCRLHHKCALHCGVPPSGELDARDTGSKPQESRGVATHHVAEVVHPEVESTEPNGQDQQSGAQYQRDLCAPAMDPEDSEDVGEHAVADQRAHRVATRKTPAVVLEERGGIGRPRAADLELEHRIEQTAAGERSEPAAQQDPLTPGREDEAHPER